MPQANQQSEKQWKQTSKSVPASALCFNVGAFEFAQSDGKASEPGKPTPVTLLGRTGKPIAHWYWGNVVHDMAGMKLAKDTLPIDYCHLPDEVIGYLDKFDTKSGDLMASGALVPFKADDRASEVYFKAQNKVPYEASINFAGGPMRLEELEVGTAATVNGNLVQGPALIIREWTLRGIAICPYGADMNTRTELSAKSGDDAAAAALVNVTIFKEASMPTSNTAPAPQAPATLSADNKPAEHKPAAAADNVAELKQAPTEAKPQAETKPAELASPKPETPAAPKPGADYIATFGDVGARWYLEGKPFNQAAAEFIGSQNTKIAELSEQVTKLKEQLAQLPRGNDPVSFAAAPEGAGKQLPKGVSGGAPAAFAAAMAARRTPAT